MHIDHFIAEMERIAPPELAEEFDEQRIGLIVEGKKDIHSVCCALDATPSVVESAAAQGADALVVHHTPIWEPITRLDGYHATLLKLLLSSDMNLYVMHTNFDRAQGGVNDALGELLGLQDIRRMSLGICGTCTLPLEAMVHRLNGGVRVFGTISSLECLAVVGGSGFDRELINEAYHMGADAFLSAELKHAVMRVSPLPLIEATHYTLEAPAMRMLADRMGWEFIDDPPTVHMLQ
jgi:dinuclear metal center YbgI/SA1388 family protein